ncbi:L-idonate 5-dehydrogenase [Thalassococcus sp. CAU 1522]|uniref:L-idonate 5-dehydrogenase n=1 Tax=Thalassococcus arenae TaxID=2851652 RepID=A0ABS6N661_9RHOB|nr:L-idonate 5-dehydrogenase [Thalassococcus arenae]MBV2359498.1 L-idonate 5-dehydrogenase [Thalassococcus arenae]
MKALVLHAARDLRVEDRPDPQPGPGQVLAAIAKGGICGSDLHYFQHGGIGSMIRLREPMILGHEVSGHVAALGAGVDRFSVGDLVAVSPSRPCGACTYCQQGQQQHCLNMRFYGSAMPMPHIQGAFRQLLVADAAQCVPAHGLSPAQAAMAEPLAVCLHAVNQAGALMGKTVLITGCGPIGCLTLLAARNAGAARIIVTDLTDFTLSTARGLGADLAVNVGTHPDALTPLSEGKGKVDVHFECSGAAQALATGVAVLRPGGVLVQLGLGGDATVPLQAMTVKELTLRGSFRFHREFASAVQAMQSGRIDVSPLLSGSYPMEDAAAALDHAADRNRAMKISLDFA